MILESTQAYFDPQPVLSTSHKCFYCPNRLPVLVLAGQDEAEAFWDAVEAQGWRILGPCRDLVCGECRVAPYDSEEE